MLVESKSNLARLMATENLMVEQKHVQTAYFDLKNRVLVVPILDGNLSPELYDLLLGHEVGHALETPEEGWHNSVINLKVNRSILNVCEDVRIEKKIKRKFPGIRVSFVKGYRELMDRDFFGVKDKDLNELNFIDRINLHSKSGAIHAIEFDNEEYELLKEVEQTESFDDVIEVAKKIEAFMREQLKEQKQSITFKIQQESEEDGGEAQSPQVNTVEMDFTGDSEKGDSEAKEDEAKGETEKQKASSNEEPEDDGSDDAESDGKSGGTGSAGADDALIESETDKSFRQKEEELYMRGKSKEFLYSNVPDVLLENVIVDYKTIISDIETTNVKQYPLLWNPEKMRESLNKFRKESNKVVSYLVKEFEMRKNAEQQSRASISKTGELNMSRIQDYKFTDDIFARMTKVPNGKSHGLVMFIDWSGSMQDHINPTIKQLLNLVMFCKKVNIPFDVYAFHSSGILNDKTDTFSGCKKVTVLKVGDIAVQPFSLLNILSHKMTANEFTKMASYLLDYGTGGRFASCSNFVPPDNFRLSGTPLNEAIIAAMTLVPEFRKQNRLEVVNTVFLTDGEGSSLGERIDNIREGGHHWDGVRIDSNWKTRSILRDPVTKATAEILSCEKRTYGSYQANQTVALLKLLKQRTNTNLIGFYVAKLRDVRQALNIYSPEKELLLNDKRIIDFRKNNFTYLLKAGYDEYYFLRSDKIDTDDEDEFEVTTNTTRGLVNAFSKYTGGRISNRIVLNRFINLIA